MGGTGFDEKMQNVRKKGRELETPEQRVQEKEMGHGAHLQWGLGNSSKEVRETEWSSSMEQEMHIINL